MKPARIQAVVALCIGMLSAPLVRAHEYWLAPSRYRAAKGDTVALRQYVGTGFRGEPKPYATPRTARLDVRAGRTFDLRPVALNGAEESGRFVAADAGGVAAAYQSRFAFIELPGREFERYLELEGLEAARRARAAQRAAPTPGRERYARCAKAWVAGSDSTRATTPFGLTLELTPLGDPLAGSEATFQLDLRGKPLAGALVRAWVRPLANDVAPTNAATRDSVPPCFEARTDAGGRVRVPTARAGEYLVSAVHMEPSEDRAEADWQSWWASFTFARSARRR